jgi:selenocysteine lyase/cysteine desulfurase
MSSRREFLALGALFTPAAALAALRARPAPRPLADLLAELAGKDQGDEDYWATVATAFTCDRSMVNLNHGGCCPAPAFVLEAMKRHLDLSNQAPTYHMWKLLEPQREGVRQRLAAAWGVDPEELALTRNASESLQILQCGFDLVRGDEVVATSQDYPRMLTTFEQRARRDGVRLIKVQIPTPCEDPSEIVRRYAAALTPRTKLILCCHVINLTGQVLPVKALAALGRERGIPVLVDGAHAFAHLDFKLTDLDCDYYATSLHKWLLAPVGNGLLYVRKDRIRPLWPLQAAPEKLDADVRKFEEIGTHPAANCLATAEALTFHLGIGAARKEARLRFLRDHWAKRLSQHERVKLHTSLKPGAASGIACVQVQGVDTKELCAWLWDKRRIWTVAIDHQEFQGLRISPNVGTTLEELDRFCSAVEHVLQHGLTG